MSLTKAYKQVSDTYEHSLPQNEDGSIPSIQLARSGKTNSAYTKALERILRPVQAQIRTKTLSNKAAEPLMRQAFIEGCIKGWKNVLKSDVTGQESDEGFAEFSYENAEALLTKLPELYEELVDKSNDLSLYRENEAEESAKN